MPRSTESPADGAPAHLGTIKPGQGQWAAGDRTALNPNEAMKAEDDGLNVRERVETVYAAGGFASIPRSDLTGRLRWWGLYTQRKPGIDGGRTATLEPEELEDEFFMMRVRSDGGRLTLEQLRTIATISTEFGRDTADVSDRQNIQLHWIRIEDVPEIWRRLESVGLSTAEACGDVPRVILGSPVAGVAVDEIVDGTPAIEEILRRHLNDPAYSNLPRKFKSAISGSPRLDVAHEINDISFVGVVHPEHGPGFDLWVGGGLSTNPMLAQRLGVWVPLDEVPDVWVAMARLYRDYGFRRLRTRARLKFLLADWGVERMREVLEKEYVGHALLDGPPPAPAPEGRRDHVGVHQQVDGRFWVGVAPVGGRVSGTVLAAVADLAERHGSGRVRLTPHQNLLVLDVPEAEVDGIVAGLESLRLPVHPSEWRRGVMACTGIEFCKLAIVETKALAERTVAELEDRLPTFDSPLTLHVNGCPNSCARAQVADIGLKGVLVTGDDGVTREGFAVLLGGSLGEDAALARKTRALKVTSDELPDYVERVATRYLEERTDGEPFAVWARRAEEDSLR